MRRAWYFLGGWLVHIVVSDLTKNLWFLLIGYAIGMGLTFFFEWAITKLWNWKPKQRIINDYYGSKETDWRKR